MATLEIQPPSPPPPSSPDVLPVPEVNTAEREAREAQETAQKTADAQAAEANLDKSDTAAETTDTATEERAVSPVESVTNGIASMTSAFEKMQLKISMLLAPILAPFRRMGVKVPDILHSKIPGVTELLDASLKNNRSIASTDEDPKLMQNLLDVYAKAESVVKTKGGTYGLAQFMEEAMSGTTKKNITLENVIASAQRLVTEKEKLPVAPPVVAPAAPATPVPAAPTK